MKKALILLMAVAITAVPLRSSFAGDKEWATAGKVLTGLAALAIISDLVSDHEPVYVVAPPPPPRRVIHVRVPRPVWVEGRYVEVMRKEWVPGHFEREWVPPAYERVWVATRFGGFWREVVVRPGYDARRWCRGYYIDRVETEWVPGHWEEI